MSSAAVQLFVGRATREEGLRLKPYDDKTGKPVLAPVGNLSWGIGFNLMQIGSPALFALMLTYLLETIYEPPLAAYTWYQHADPARQSVLLDVAYNEGVGGLVHGFPNMINAVARQDWTEAAKQCKVADASLDASRYAPLRKIMLNGAPPP